MEEITVEEYRARLRRGKGRKVVDQVETLAALIQLHAPELGSYEREVQFAPPRLWAFDLAYPLARLAVEVDGGQWVPQGGRHNRDSDRAKLNAAAATGWRVLRFSSQMLDHDPLACLAVLRQALAWASDAPSSEVPE